MKFSTRKDVAITDEALFDALTDFDRMERLMKRRGAKVEMLDQAAEGVMAWNVTFDLRGRKRKMKLVLAGHDRPEAVRFNGTSDSFDFVFDFTFVALTRSRSRVMAELDIRPITMKARLIVQTAKLGKGQLDRKFESQIGIFVDQMLA